VAHARLASPAHASLTTLQHDVFCLPQKRTACCSERRFCCQRHQIKAGLIMRAERWVHACPALPGLVKCEQQQEVLACSTNFVPGHCGACATHAGMPDQERPTRAHHTHPARCRFTQRAHCQDAAGSRHRRSGASDAAAVGHARGGQLRLRALALPVRLDRRARAGPAVPVPARGLPCKTCQGA